MFEASPRAPALPDETDGLFVGDPARGWQRQATAAVEDKVFQGLSAGLDPAALALLESQQGRFASRVLTALPTVPELTAPSHLFRTVLLRRLRLPLPVTEKTCRCHRRLDPLGDHRAACSTPGVLQSCGRGLERAAARVCCAGDFQHPPG